MPSVSPKPTTAIEKGSLEDSAEAPDDRRLHLFSWQEPCRDRSGSVVCSAGCRRRAVQGTEHVEQCTSGARGRDRCSPVAPGTRGPSTADGGNEPCATQARG